MTGINRPLLATITPSANLGSENMLAQKIMRI